MIWFFLWLFRKPWQKANEEEDTSTKSTFLHDAIIFTVLFAAAIGVCIALSHIIQWSADISQIAVPVFILAVSLVARFTRGYVWGIAASFLGVFCVNYIFTFPYWEFNFTVTGYPLIFSVMLIVSMLISTLTTRITRQEQLRMEVEMEKMRANLLRSVSHDLRTPLTTIIGSSSVLLENNELLERQKRELVGEINREAKWLARITENILSVTKFSNGKTVNLHLESEVVEEIVSGAIVKFHQTHPGMPITVSKPDDILLAKLDATLIEQVIVNLFDNVVIHAESANRIWVSISRSGQFVRISVADNGSGFSQQVLRHLFDGQASLQDNSDGKHGMGIGLSVCYSIIKAHGGNIRGRNQLGGGACIEFDLPEDVVTEEEGEEASEEQGTDY